MGFWYIFTGLAEGEEEQKENKNYCMTALEIKKFARNKILKATAILLTVLTILFLLGETNGDLANGILFFMVAIANIHH